VVALEELIAQGLVEEVRGGANEQTLNYDFCHEQLRALVNEETSLARKRLLHRRVAETLVNRMRENRSTGMLAGQIAYHYQMAGNEAAAAEYFKLAGELARSLYANAEALAHLRMALALGHPDAAALHVSIGDLYTLLGEYGNALKSYETAAALCAPPALANVEHKIGNVYERRGEWDQAESHLEAALAAIEEGGPSGERARIYADWSLAAYHRGQVDQAMNLAEQALGQAEAAHDVQALAQAHNIVGMLASKQQKLEEAQHHLEQSLALAEELNDPSVRVAALNNLALVCRTGGAIERAIKLTQDALALCVSQGDRHREAALHNNLADLFHAAGNSEAAMSHLKQAVSIYAEIGVEEGTVRTEIWKLADW
jgi:tetratricopeptide (TPR) repeat protein